MRPSLLLRVSVRLEDVLGDLRSLSYGLDNIRSGRGSELRQAYLQWVETAERTLRSRFEPDALVDELYTTRFWHLATMENIDGRDSPFNRLIELENRAQHARLKAIEDELKTIHDAFLPPADGLLVVMDTCFLLHGEWFEHVDWRKHIGAAHVRLVLLHVVIDELDDVSHWQSDPKTAGRASKVLRAVRKLRADAPATDCVTVGHGAYLQVLLDPRPHERLGIRDAEIIERSLLLNQLVAGRLRVLTHDYGMQLRAVSAGLQVAAQIERPANEQAES